MAQISPHGTRLAFWLQSTTPRLLSTFFCTMHRISVHAYIGLYIYALESLYVNSIVTVMNDLENWLSWMLVLDRTP